MERMAESWAAKASFSGLRLPIRTKFPILIICIAHIALEVGCAPAQSEESAVCLPSLLKTSQNNLLHRSFWCSTWLSITSIAISCPGRPGRRPFRFTHRAKRRSLATRGVTPRGANHLCRKRAMAVTRLVKPTKAASN